MKREINKNLKELKSFFIFIMGQFVSQFGSKMTSYGLVLWAYKQSGSVLSTSFLTVCYLFPEILLSFIAGSVSDSWNKKKIILASDAIAAFFSCIVIGLLLTNNLRIEYLYFINIMLGITDAFQYPASEVTVSLLVSKENYMKTSGIQSFCNSFITIFSPVVTTSIYAFVGLTCIIFIDLITFLFAFLSLALWIKIPDITDKTNRQLTFLKDCKQGLAYIVSRKEILHLILFMAFVNFIAAIYNNNLAPMILARNGNNDIQLGIVSSAIGIAGLFGSILVTKFPNTKKRIPFIFNIMTFSFLICNSLLGVGRNYYLWTLAVFMGNCFIPFLIAHVEYIMRTKVPVTIQGRVFSARNTMQYLTIPIGYLFGGFVADKVLTPFMSKPSHIQSLLQILVGEGKGSGIALIYLGIAVLGGVGCCVFRFSSPMKSLDDIS
jgi:MFS family permease